MSLVIKFYFTSSLLNMFRILIQLIPLQTSHTETPTHIETRTHDQCGGTIEKSRSPDDGCINVRNMWSVEKVK